MSTVTIPIDTLRSAAILALKKKGADEIEAATVVDDYVDADLRGRLSHGFVSFSVALGAFPKKGAFCVVSDTGSTLTIAGNGDTGHVVTRRAIDLVEGRMKSIGVCAIGIRSITRFNCPGAIARYAGSKGLFAIVLEYGGQNFMTPPGGAQAVLSTNPIGIAVPFTDPAFVVDIATSEKAFGYVTMAKATSSSIPSSWGVDKEGRPTTDPNLVASVSPFGGHKGFALGLAIEILAGALVGVSIGAKGTLAERGALILLLHPGAFGVNRDDLASTIQAFLQEVRACRVTDGNEPIRYPGEAGEARLNANRASGQITLPTTVWNQIQA